MSNFQAATAKLTIKSLDPGGPEVSAQYNPKELQIDKAVPWSKHAAANKTNAKEEKAGIHLEFTGAEGRSMSVELLFDGYENKGKIASGGTVIEKVKALEELASVRKPNSKKEDERRPHWCVVTWGQKGIPSFRCVIESLSTKYQMFSEDGLPLRATCTVKLKEADLVSLAKAK
ncbi:MAG: hypothetical protein H0T79_07230 [Deltaproteobacteria bacterium]|nr:hypothetical protein [Deltaproteobacteria bacterium]